mmetsp:Transcript_20798/g.46429  ORF Transcript_20798/g.46429 Transcript_20798/m.46429 type:complete len:259 (+) Transcript_20798:770-1546(+)
MMTVEKRRRKDHSKSYGWRITPKLLRWRTLFRVPPVHLLLFLLLLLLRRSQAGNVRIIPAMAALVRGGLPLLKVLAVHLFPEQDRCLIDASEERRLSLALHGLLGRGGLLGRSSRGGKERLVVLRFVGGGYLDADVGRGGRRPSRRRAESRCSRCGLSRAGPITSGRRGNVPGGTAAAAAGSYRLSTLGDDLRIPGIIQSGVSAVPAIAATRHWANALLFVRARFAKSDRRCQTSRAAAASRVRRRRHGRRLLRHRHV